MDNKEKDIFSYTYSAKQQDEIKRIRSKYTDPDNNEDKMSRLRRLDQSVTRKAVNVSLTFGIVGALILGFGMSLIMSEFNAVLGLSSVLATVIGITVGIAGMALVCTAYPVYNLILKKEREKLAPEILRLTDELIDHINKNKRTSYSLKD